MRPRGEIEDDLVREMKNQLDPDFSLKHWKFERDYVPDPHGDKLRKEDSMWMDGERIVHYHPSLSIPERTEALAALDDNLVHLEEGLWLDLPILFTPPGVYLAPSELKGFVTIPIDFKVIELKTYLDEYVV